MAQAQRSQSERGQKSMRQYGGPENASTSDRNAFRRLITDKKAEILSSFTADIRRQGATPCRKAIRQLQAVGGPLEIR